MTAPDVLKASPLFKGFTATGVQIIANISNPRTFPQGVPLFVESMVADAMFVVGEGQVRLTTRNKGGEEVAVGELGPGDWLGELSLIQPGQRLCTATALTKVSALEIRHADFQKLLTAKPQACVKLLMSIVSLFGQKVLDNKDTFKALLTK